MIDSPYWARFGAIDGSSSYHGSTPTERLNNALIHANGRTVILPPGEHTLSLDFTLNDITSVHIVGSPGATVIKYANTTPALQFRSTYASAQTVSAISVVTDGSASGSDDSIARLTVDDASEYAEGDILKLYSEDASYYASSSDKNYAGELVEVRYVDTGNNYVFIKGLLVCASQYATSIKVRKIDKRSVILEDLIIDIDDSTYDLYDDSITSRASAIRLWGIHCPVVRNVTFRRAWGQCLNLIACWLPDITARQDQVINGTDTNWTPGVDALGYGVTTMCCYGGHIKLFAEGCRHSYTSVHPEDSSFNSSRWLEYGESNGVKVSGIFINSEGAPLDTHESGVNTIFENCLVINPRRGETGSIRSKGFNNRARGTIYNNCHVIGAYMGFMNSAIDHGAKHVVRYNNCSAIKCYGTAQEAFYFKTSTNAPDIYMDNCHVSDSYRMIGANGGNVYITGGTYKVKNDWFAKVYTGAKLHVHGALVDFTDSVATEQLIRMAGTSTATITATHITEGSSKCSGLFYDEDGSGTKTCRYGAVTSTTGTLAKSATGSATSLSATNILLA